METLMTAMTYSYTFVLDAENDDEGAMVQQITRAGPIPLVSGDFVTLGPDKQHGVLYKVQAIFLNMFENAPADVIDYWVSVVEMEM